MLTYLTGYMGSGKTTAGKKLADRLGYTFIDLDKYIENKYRITIPHLFARYDEGAFRKLEKETITETFKLKNAVISTGGGTP
jgi:shikimate kinase